MTNEQILKKAIEKAGKGVDLQMIFRKSKHKMRAENREATRKPKSNNSGRARKGIGKA